MFRVLCKEGVRWKEQSINCKLISEGSFTICSLDSRPSVKVQLQSKPIVPSKEQTLENTRSEEQAKKEGLLWGKGHTSRCECAQPPKAKQNNHATHSLHMEMYRIRQREGMGLEFPQYFLPQICIDSQSWEHASCFKTALKTPKFCFPLKA